MTRESEAVTARPVGLPSVVPAEPVIGNGDVKLSTGGGGRGGLSTGEAQAYGFIVHNGGE